MTDRLAPDDAALLASIMLGEGLRLKSYPDPLTHASPWTIAYGHTGPDIGPGMSCTMAQAETWLQADIANAMAVLDAKEPWWRTMTLDRQRVLCEMCFNLGYGHLITFHRFLVDLQSQCWADAAAEMLASAWARQVGSRAKRLAERMRGDATDFGADITKDALHA